jgi:GntR family transcriptional regulator/MocR family aminotransferase
MTTECHQPAITLVHLDPALDTPLHEQIYSRLRHVIIAGMLAPGMRLPSTRMLASELKVSRNTVIGAFEQLFAEGYLEARVGAGTYVVEELPENALAIQSRAPSQKRSSSPRPLLSERGVTLASHAMPWPPASKPGPAFRVLPTFDRLAIDQWTKISNKVWHRESGRLIKYGDAAGYKKLREEIASYLVTARGVKCRSEQVIVVDGSQQALDMSVRMLLNPGDPVWIEDPGYVGARAAFLGGGADTIPVPVDSEGLDVAAGLARHPNPRLVYVTPSHQWPLGSVMSIDRRHELLKLASSVGAWIIEDDYDSEFRYSGRPLQALQGLDNDGRVIYIGTFSKVLFPSLRLGYIVVPEDLVDAFTAARLVMGFHSPVPSQIVLAEFMAQGHFVRHLRRMRKLYADRQQVLLKAAAAELGDLLALEESEAGMQLIGWLPGGESDTEAAQRAADAGINTIPLSMLYMTPAPAPALILGYTGVRPPLIWRGARDLATALRKK